MRGGSDIRREKMCLPATRPAPHGLDKIQPESVQKHSKSERVGADRGGSVRFCGLDGFLPSPTLGAQVKPKVVDKGKAKVADTGKPTKAVYPIMTGGDFKIREPKVPTPPSLPVNLSAKRGLLEEKPKKPPKVARVLRLLDE
jgi:hypothetical protein